MKRMTAAVLSLCLLICFSLSVYADGTAAYVTGFDYTQIRTGGVGDTLVYGAYDQSGGYVIGTMDKTGELTREAYTADRFNSLFAPHEWTTVIKGDASALCPKASTHKDNTICPYLDVLLVDMTHSTTGAVFSDVYVEDTSINLLPDGSIHYCFGNYVYQSPITLKWDGSSRYLAHRNADGLWGVYDIDNNTMAKGYLYDDMSAVYGTVCKVFDGLAWGRLDLGSVAPPVFSFASEDGFDVIAKSCKQDDGTFVVRNGDDEIISSVFAASFADVTYIADAKAVLCTAVDGSKTLCDLSGTTLATFAADEDITHLQDDCFAVTKHTASGAIDGVALFVADGLSYPEGLVLTGDVDQSGEVSTTDARLILRYLVRVKPLTELQRLAADYNGDGAVRAQDVREMLMDVSTEV